MQGGAGRVPTLYQTNPLPLSTPADCAPTPSRARARAVPHGCWTRRKEAGMHVFMSPKDAAAVLGVDERTVRNRIRSGAIRHVFTNGGVGAGVRYTIDMTREFGLEATYEGEREGAA